LFPLDSKLDLQTASEKDILIAILKLNKILKITFDTLNSKVAELDENP